MLQRFKQSAAMFVCAMLCGFSIAGATSAFASDPDALPKLVILEFKADGVSAEDARRITELVRLDFLSSGQYELVPRAEIDENLKLVGTSSIGTNDFEPAIKLGRLIGARVMLLGSVMKIGDALVISGRIIDVESGKTTKVVKTSAPGGGQVLAAVNEFSEKIFSGLSTLPVSKTEPETRETPVHKENGKSEVVTATIATSKAAYRIKEDVVVTFGNFPATKYDYITISVKNSGPDEYIVYQYCRSRKNGSLTFKHGLQKPGEYEARAHTNYRNGDVNYTVKCAFSVQ